MQIKFAKNKRKRKRSGQRQARRWVITVTAAGTLFAYTIGNSRDVKLAYHAHAATVIARSQNQSQDQRVRFDIPPGALETVLETFQTLTGWRVSLPNDEVRSIGSPGVSGMYTVEQALQQLLTGTGISYRVTEAKTITLEIQAQAESVEVRDAAETRVSSPKYTEPLRDIPQTITVISKEVIEEQAATTLRDVLRNVPGLTFTAGEGGVPAGDNLTLRGFSARNDIFIDGARDLGPQSRDPFNLEQVEVVKGPGSAYTGRGSAGGSINLVSKTPGVLPIYGGTLNLGTDGTKRATVDINLPFEKFGWSERAAFRLNAMMHESGVAGRDVTEDERWGVAPSLSFGLNTPTRFVVSYFHLQQNNVPDYGIPWVPATNNALIAFRDRPAPVPRDTFYGLRSRDFEDVQSDLATARFERDFGDNLTLRNQFRFGRSTRDSVTTAPRFLNNDSTSIDRGVRAWITEDNVVDNQSDFRADFSTGGVRHTLVTGLALARESNLRRTRTTVGSSVTTLLNPNPNDAFNGSLTVNPIVGDVTANSQGLYAFDTARLGKRWELSGGLRWDRFDVDGVSTTNLPLSRVDRMLSGRAGVVFKPVESGSLYASYGTALNPSLEGLSYNTANTAIDPEKTYTFEVGSKWGLFGNRLLLTGAGFRVEKTNARTPGISPNDPPQVLEGRQRVDGIELGATGTLRRGWSVFGAYTLLDSEIVESNTAAEVGRRILNTPRNSFNLWTSYETPWRLDVGGGARLVGRRFGNNINTRFVDSYWTVDATASYPLTKRIDLRLNLYNLFDEFYFDRLSGGHLVPGAGRSVMLSTGFRF